MRLLLMYFVLLGLLMLMSKGSRLIYIIISFESMMAGALMFNLPLMGELNYIMALLFSVVSSVLGLLMMVMMLSTYGSENVHF